MFFVLGNGKGWSLLLFYRVKNWAIKFTFSVSKLLTLSLFLLLEFCLYYKYGFHCFLSLQGRGKQWPVARGRGRLDQFRQVKNHFVDVQCYQPQNI